MFTNTLNLIPNIYNVKLGYNDVLSNIIKVHVQYPLQSHDKKKIMRDLTLMLTNIENKLLAWDRQPSTSSTTLPHLPPNQNAILWAHHQSSTKGCCSKNTINRMLAYWTLLARQVRTTTKKMMNTESQANLNPHNFRFED